MSDPLPVEENEDCLVRESPAGNTEVVQVFVTDEDGLILCKDTIEGKQPLRTMSLDTEATEFLHERLDEHRDGRDTDE